MRRAPLALVVLLFACTFYHPKPLPEHTRVGPYWGPACVKIGAPTNSFRGNTIANPTYGKQPNLAHEPADQIFRLVCVDAILGAAPGEPERNTWVMQHHRFDDVLFDHFTASQMLVQCLLADTCLDAPHVVRPTSHPRPTPVRSQYYQAGMMRWYAANVDPQIVQQQLGELALPSQAIDAYTSLLARARTEVVTFTEGLRGEEKRAFVDIPMEVFVRRQAEYARSSSFVDELRALAPMTNRAPVSDEIVDRLVKLRIAYARSCKTTCTKGAVFAAMTKTIFSAYVTRGDAPAATAEAALLDNLDPTAAQEIAQLQTEQLDDARYVYAWDSRFRIGWKSRIPRGEVLQFEGRVAGIDRRGADVTLRFHDIVSEFEEGTDCYESHRIERIGRDGRVTYRVECNDSKPSLDRREVAPVTMPASESAGIMPGDEVIGFTSFGPKQERVGGRVWVVRRGQRLVRLRDVPL